MMRESLINSIFGQSTLPTSTPTVSAESGGCTGIPNCGGTDKLTLDMGNGEINYAYHHTPQSSSLNRLAIVVQGHADDYNAHGIGLMRDALIDAGFNVVMLGMPGRTGNQGASHDSHNELSDLRYFVEPAIAILNLLASGFDDVMMTGISGGGWTVTVVAAIDPRIKYSIPVAGTLPLAMRAANSIGDWEQVQAGNLLDWPGWYALGILESGRKQRQILNQNDACCFASSGANGAYGGSCYQHTVNAVNGAAKALGALGEFSWFEDTTHSLHTISQHAIDNAILPFLGIEPPPPPDVFVVDNQDAGLDHTPGTPNTINQKDKAVRWDHATLFAGGWCYSIDWQSGPSRKFTYAFNVDPGTYKVIHKFHRATSRADNVTVKAYDDGTLIETWSHNQKGVSGLVEVQIGQATTTTGLLTIELSNSSSQNGQMVADLIKLESV